MTTDYIMNANSPLKSTDLDSAKSQEAFSTKFNRYWSEKFRFKDKTLMELTIRDLDRLINAYPDEYDHLKFVRDNIWF